MKTISCIRDELNQNKIFAFEEVVRYYDLDFKKTSSIIGLIGNEVRLKLVWLIASQRFCVCDLADILQMSVPAISQHLRKLKDIGIVDFTREKQTLYYHIAKENKVLVDHIIEILPPQVEIKNEKKIC